MRPFPSSLREPIVAYRANLRAVFGDRLRDVRLFGSFARGEADEDSDVDVLVLVDGLSESERGIAIGAVADVIVQTGLPLSPLALSTERFEALRASGRALARDIDEQGIPL